MAQAAWIWWLGGGVLALAGLWLLWWSLFRDRDRARGRRRCPKCWYDMGGVPGLVCPECGHDEKRERALRKTRRRWKLAAAAVLVLVGAVAMLSYPQYRQFGALSLVPTDILLCFNPAPGHEYGWDPTASVSAPDPVSAELTRRIERSGLSSRHWNRLMHDERLYLVRPSWPADESLTIAVALPVWIGAEVTPELVGVNPGELRMRMMIDGWEGDAVDLAVNNGSFGPRAFRLIEFPHWCLDGDQVTLSAALYFHAFDDVLDEQTRVPVWRGSIPVSVKLVDNTHEAILPCEDTELNRRVAEKMQIELDYREFTDQRSRAFLWLSLDESITPHLSELAVGVRVEIQRDGETVAEFSGALLPWDFDLQGETGRRLYVEVPSVAEQLSQEHLPQEIERWAVHVIGDSDSAIRDVNKPRYWAGDFERPLKDALRTKK